MTVSLKWSPIYLPVLLGVVLVLVLGSYIWLSKTRKATSSASTSLSVAVSPTPTTSPSVSPTPVQTAKILNYTTQDVAFGYAKDGRSLLFFTADWCESCTVATQDIQKNLAKLPANLVILAVDYDHEKTLKQRYAVTAQHTWIQVGSDGSQIARWTGGGSSEIINYLK